MPPLTDCPPFSFFALDFQIPPRWWHELSTSKPIQALSRLITLPDMSSPDTTTPRGLLPPGLRRRLQGYFGIRSRFQAAAWCKSTFFPPTYLLAPGAIPVFFTASFKRDALFLFLAYMLIVYAKDIWAHLRRGQLDVLFRNRELRDHAFAEFYHAERKLSELSSSAHSPLHLHFAFMCIPHSGPADRFNALPLPLMTPTQAASQSNYASPSISYHGTPAPLPQKKCPYHH